ncbi:MFS-type efflux pump MSMEG_3705-like [Ptychodera flava]|uniref:MFS-type efflux pump MSMEG_3705-like n=1 Tax=Ptychodera flava TaxID=63121 RepID=UPI00396A08B8
MGETGSSTGYFYKDFVHHVSNNKYPLYVAWIMMMLLASNQISRYVIVATNVQMANEMHFGDRECRTTERRIPKKDDICRKNMTLCEVPSDNHSTCTWHYTGTGVQYQLLAGPLFNVIFGITGVFVGVVMERNRNNRKNVIAACAISWSSMLIFGSYASSFIQLALTRLGVAFFEAAFAAFAASLLSSYFPPNLRAMAMSLFMCGVNIGYSLAYVIKMVAAHSGWRHAYFVTGLPGIILGILTYCTIREPATQLPENVQHKESSFYSPLTSFASKHMSTRTLAPAPFINPLFAVIVVGGAIRCGGGHTFYYNIHNYINHYYPGFPTENYLSWIPAVAGLLGSLSGGIIADRIAIHYEQGYVGRLRVILFSLVLSLPCAMLVLSLPPPLCFLMLIPGYVVNEMWSGIAITAVVEQAPPGRTNIGHRGVCFRHQHDRWQLDFTLAGHPKNVQLENSHALALARGVYVCAIHVCMGHSSGDRTDAEEVES